MILENARELGEELKKSEEYEEYRRCRDAVFADESARALLAEYNKLKRSAQGAIATGREIDELSAHKLNKLSEWLQMNADTAAFLMAEYRLNRLLGDIYRTLAEAVDIRMDFLEE